MKLHYIQVKTAAYGFILNAISPQFVSEQQSFEKKSDQNWNFFLTTFDLFIKYWLVFNLIYSLRRRIYKPVWSYYVTIPSRQLSKPANLYICDIPTKVYCNSSPISWFRCRRKPKLQFRLCSDKGWTRCQFHDHRQILWGSITYAIANSIYT